MYKWIALILVILIGLVLWLAIDKQSKNVDCLYIPIDHTNQKVMATNLSMVQSVPRESNRQHN